MKIFKNKLIAGLFVIILFPIISFNTVNAMITSVSTESASFSSSSSAYLNGIVNFNTYNGNANVWFEYGVDSNLSNYESTKNTGFSPSFESGFFTQSLPDLSSDATYYYRAVAQDIYGTIFRGEIVPFNTLGVITQNTNNNYDPYHDTYNNYSPTAITSSASSISNKSANLKAIINPDNYSTYYQFEYGTTEYNLTSITIPKNVGAFDSRITVSAYINDLLPDTNYYFRVVTNNTNYGEILRFKTLKNESILEKKQPIAITTTAVSINQGSAILNGNITPNNDLTIAWFEWSEDPNFISNVRKNADHTIGSQSGEVYFAYSLTNLTIDKTYYFRAVAKNSYGTNYGDIHNFTTRIPSQNADNTYTPPVFSEPVSANGLLTIGAEFNKSKSRPGKEVIYTVNYKNDVDSVLKNTVLKIKLPNEVEYKDSSFANVDLENNTASFNIGDIIANDSGSISIKFQITELAEVEVLKFNSNITYLSDGNRGTENLVSELEVTSSILMASAFDILGGIFDNPFISLLFGISLGLGIYHFVIKKKQIIYEDDPLK